MHGVPFRFVWSALAWPCMAAAHLVSGGQVSACGYHDGSHGEAHSIARPGRQGPTSKEACAFTTHPRKGMTLDAFSLGDSAREGDRSPPSIDKGLTESPEKLPSNLFLYIARGKTRGGQGRGSASNMPTRVRGRQRTEIDAAPFLACTVYLGRLNIVCCEKCNSLMQCQKCRQNTTCSLTTG